MSETSKDWRFIDDGDRGGAANMARDEAMALCRDPSLPACTLRTYRFSPPAVTLGRFQAVDKTVDAEACAREGVTLVRRATGGLAILHLDDFTYSVVMRGAEGLAGGRRTCFDTVARGILAALESLGIEASQVEHSSGASPGGGWCLEGIRGVDLEWKGRKICGSAQRVFGGAVLQHGSLFLEDTAEVMRRIGSRDRGGVVKGQRFVCLREAVGREVTWEETREAFRTGFERALGIVLEPGLMSTAEDDMALELERDKYDRDEWTVRRGLESRVGGL